MEDHFHLIAWMMFVPGNWNSNKILSYLVLSVIICLTTIIRYNLIDFPLERDEGTYLYFASLILDGNLPYESFYDPKPVGLYYTYAAIIYLFGSTLQQLHFAFLLINIISILLIYQIGRLLFGTIGGLSAAASFAFLSLNPHIGGPSLLSEHLVLLLVNSGILALLYAHRKNQTILFFIAGLCLGISFCEKQNGLFFIAAGFVYLFPAMPWRDNKKWRESLNHLMYFSFASILPFLMFFSFFVLKGLAYEFIYWHFLYPFHYSQDVPFKIGLKYLVQVLPNVIHGYTSWYLMSFLGLCLVIFNKRLKSNRSLFIIIWLFSLLAVTPRWTFHGHYFLFLISILSLSVGLLFAFLERHFLEVIKSPIMSLCLSGLLVGMMIYQVVTNHDVYLKPDYEKIFRAVYGSNPFLETQKFGQFIKNRASDSDDMVVFGAELQLYYYSGLKASTKHLYGPYLVDGSEEHQIRQREFIRDLESKKPRFFVAVRHPLSWMVKENADLTIMEWYDTFTKQNYNLVGLAEINQGDETRYLWEDDLMNYQEQGDHQVYLWQLKELPVIP